MKVELTTIQRNETWQLTNLPVGKNVVGLKWIFQKHKSRLVAKGYSQQQGIDFGETFSPIA